MIICCEHCGNYINDGEEFIDSNGRCFCSINCRYKHLRGIK